MINDFINKIDSNYIFSDGELEDIIQQVYFNVTDYNHKCSASTIDNSIILSIDDRHFCIDRFVNIDSDMVFFNQPYEVIKYIDPVNNKIDFYPIDKVRNLV